MLVLELLFVVVIGGLIGLVGGVAGREVGKVIGGEAGLVMSTTAGIVASTATGFGIASIGVIFDTAGTGDLDSVAMRLVVAAGEKSSESSSFSTSLIRTRLLEITGGFDDSDADDSGFLTVFSLVSGFDADGAVVDGFAVDGFAVGDGVPVVPCFSFASSSLTALLAGSIVSAVSKSSLASSTLPSDRRAIPRLQSAFTFLLSSFSPNVQSRSASANL